jgi:hypothetical protein
VVHIYIRKMSVKNVTWSGLRLQGDVEYYFQCSWLGVRNLDNGIYFVIGFMLPRVIGSGAVGNHQRNTASFQLAPPVSNTYGQVAVGLTWLRLSCFKSSWFTGRHGQQHSRKFTEVRPFSVKLHSSFFSFKPG